MRKTRLDLTHPNNGNFLDAVGEALRLIFAISLGHDGSIFQERYDTYPGWRS